MLALALSTMVGEGGGKHKRKLSHAILRNNNHYIEVFLQILLIMIILF